MRSITTIAAAIALAPTIVSAALQCYNIQGTTLGNTYAPCDPNATVSACCELNRDNPDVCLGNGLCMSVRNDYAGTIWGDGCTDKTGNDDTCPQICAGKVAKGEYWNIMQCPQQGQWCCRAFGDWTSCCNDSSRHVDVRAADVTPLLPLTDEANRTTDATSSESGSNAGLVGGVVGGVLGAALLVSFVAAALLWRQNRQLKESAKGYNAQDHPPYSAVQYSETSSEQKPYPQPYQVMSPVEADGTPTRHTSELPGPH